MNDMELHERKGNSVAFMTEWLLRACAGYSWDFEG